MRVLSSAKASDASAREAMNRRPPFSVVTITLKPSFSAPRIASGGTSTFSNTIDPVEDCSQTFLPFISW